MSTATKMRSLFCNDEREQTQTLSRISASEDDKTQTASHILDVAREQSPSISQILDDTREHTQTVSCILDTESAQSQTASGDLAHESAKDEILSHNGGHEEVKAQTASAQDDYDAKVELLRSAFCHLNADLWEVGDGERFPWVFEELDALDQELDSIGKDELVRRLRFLYKRLAYAKGRRGNHKKNGNFSGGENMPIYVEIPKQVLVARGEHHAKIVSVSQPEPSKFDQNRQSVRVTFEIVDGKHKGQRLSKYYALSMSPKSALGQLWRRLFGEPKAGSQVDLERLIGKDVSIVVTHKDSENGPYALISDVDAFEEVPVS